MKTRSRHMLAIFCAIGLLSPLAIARQTAGPQDVVKPMPAPAIWMGQHEGPVAFTEGTFAFVSSEMSFDGKVVKGAPFSAQTVNEHIQMLADGNRIVRRDSGAVYRDSEGRTRREQQITQVGPFAASKEPLQTIVITDPVADVSYFLESSSRTARKMNRRMAPMAPGVGIKKRRPDGEGPNVIVEKVEGGKAPAKVVVPDSETHETHISVVRDREHVVAHTVDSKIHARSGPPVDQKVESLGKQVIEGVEAEGTRTTRTIPAGQLGNEQPIVIVSERWYSPHLQTVVLSKHNDPRFGESSHRLVNIQLGEPPASMLQVPSDYTIQEGPPRPARVEMRRRPTEDRKQEQD